MSNPISFDILDHQYQHSYILKMYVYPLTSEFNHERALITDNHAGDYQPTF